MAPHSEKYKLLQTLKEDAFRTEVIIPLLTKMGFSQVRERHGTQEYGKDITYRSSNPLGDVFGAVVAKVGPIAGSASGKQTLSTVLDQVNMAFDMPLIDAEQQQRLSIYEVIVWTSGNIANNAENRIIESAGKYRNIRFFDGQKTIELLDKHYPAFFTVRDPYIAEYYAAAKDHYARLEELRTLGGAAEHRMLPTLFVPPTLVEFDGRRRNNVRPKLQTQSREYSFEDIVHAHDDMIILGEFGSGKTTLLRQLLRNIIMQNEQKSQKSPIPVFIPIKKINFSLPHSIEAAASSEFLRFVHIEQDNNRILDFDNGSVVLLLDSVDELKSNESVLQALQVIEQFKKTHKKTRIILSSRFIESVQRLDAVPGFRMLELRNLTPTQMVKFVQNWYGNDSQFTAKMMQLLQSPLALQGLPTTPLTLVLVSALYEQGNKEMPANLTELFQKYVELALGRWDISKEISLQFEWRVKEFLLQKVGWHMHDQERLGIAQDVLSRLLTTTAHERGLHVHPDAFCQEVVARSELLFLNEDDEYEFKHRSFKDFFAGKELDTLPDAIARATHHAHDVWWTQTIFFASSLRPFSHAYIDAMQTAAHPQGAGYLRSSYQLGHLLQGAYLAPRDVKRQAILHVLDDMLKAWNVLCAAIREVNVEDIDGRPIRLVHFNLVFVFSALAQMSLGSVTLSPIITMITEDLLISSSNDNDSVRVRREWMAFLIASACLRSGNTNDFLRLLNSDIIKEPSFRMVASIGAQYVISESWFPKHEQQRLETFVNHWQKRWDKLTVYQKSIIDTLPVPIPIDALQSTLPLLLSSSDDHTIDCQIKNLERPLGERIWKR
ncbi:MAG: NACHT domain-containing protein [Chloroflexales bacterium]